jgi:hypothetical protein
LFVASRIADLQDIRLGMASCATPGAAFQVALRIADDAGTRGASAAPDATVSPPD